MMKKILLTITLLLSVLYSYPQAYKTQPLSEDVHTVQVNKNGNWASIPVIDLSGDNYININFDILGEDSYRALKYRIINCDADWNKSRLLDIEYLDGFNDLLIDDYAQSVNTIVDYTNYNFQIPNDRQRLKLSGNYAVEVYAEDEQNKVLLMACFSVLDSKIKIDGAFSSNTDIDANKEHQQVNFSINTAGIQIRDPFSDLKVVVRQNNRMDNQRVGVKPTYIQGDKLIYEHNRDLIFDAGNEYRRFESVSYRYNGLNIASTDLTRPYYSTSIITDKVRAGKRYIYDQDQNGRYLIRNAEANDADIQADYFKTRFTLDIPEPILEPIYLNGGFTNNRFDEKYLMKYDIANKVYTADVVLKQGAYNYQYLTQSGKIYSQAKIEGNYFETENEYAVYVYYRPVGFLSDQLIGLLLISGK
ncbi:DUF5103 domain-containing protein [Dysgonomonas capnocytophagoides]|uniref:DUF5103 domain-containing protein n=2 Tax=Dysgonomonas capnocytophagoides TaxID=45254 RepID=A0A4Y8LA12_9BACT|nr:DUF5103 domain-containing protein [Dysgonomonas capnocytophagoides]